MKWMPTRKLRATKRVLECAEYEFLLQLKRRMHSRLRSLALPGQILRAGVYPISVAMVDTIEKELEDFEVGRGGDGARRHVGLAHPRDRGEAARFIRRNRLPGVDKVRPADLKKEAMTSSLPDLFCWLHF